MVQQAKITIKLTTLECGKCGVVFAMSDALYDKRSEDKETFWCPNGHGRVFRGQSADQQIAELRQEVAHQKNRVAIRQDDLDNEKSSHHRTAGKLGAATKKLKRVDNGICPECNRHFANVARHMKNKH